MSFVRESDLVGVDRELIVWCNFLFSFCFLVVGIDKISYFVFLLLCFYYCGGLCIFFLIMSLNSYLSIFVRYLVIVI